MPGPAVGTAGMQTVSKCVDIVPRGGRSEGDGQGQGPGCEADAMWDGSSEEAPPRRLTETCLLRGVPGRSRGEGGAGQVEGTANARALKLLRT